jgi:hypothetical protein
MYLRHYDATQEVPKMKTSHMHTLWLMAIVVALSLGFGVAQANGTSNGSTVGEYTTPVAGAEPWPEGYDSDINLTLEPTAAGGSSFSDGEDLSQP